jgi:hypothetical protein
VTGGLHGWSCWHSALTVLSLDFAAPVYAELGVGVNREETLRGLARDALLGRLSYGSRVDAPPAPPDLETPHFLDGVRASLGPRAEERVDHWIRFTACTERRLNPWVLYSGLLSGWANVFRRTGSDEIGFAVDPAEVEKTYSRLCSVEDIERILTVERHKAPTEWDASRFAEFDEVSAGSDFFPYVAEIELAARMSRFQGFWRWLLSYVTPADLQAIGSLAAKRARRGPFVYRSPDDLPLPRD